MIDTQYTPDFEVAISILLSHKIEGGYSDHPNDSGGVTNMGITSASLTDYCKRTGKDWTVPTLTRNQAREFYFDEYWVPLRLHDIHHQELKNVVFATAVHQGKFAAIMSLQYCAKMPKLACDGRIGPTTIAYVNAEVDQVWLVNEYCNYHREAYIRKAKIWYAKDPQFGWRPVPEGTKGAKQKNKVFEKGWVKRIDSFMLPLT